MMPWKLSFLMEILYRAIRVYIWCSFESNRIVVITKMMNTRRNVARRLEDEIPNAGAPPHGDKVPSIKKGENDYQASMNPLSFTDENIRVSLLQMTHAITT